MKLKIILYSSEITKEDNGLAEWIKEYSATMPCIPVTQDASIEDIQRLLRKNHQKKEECLYILSTDCEAKHAEELQMAYLPYVGDCQKQAYDFSKAWIVVEGFWEADVDFFEKVYERAWNLPWTILSTERCILREFCMDDMQALFDLYAKPGVTDYMEPLYDWEKEWEYEEAYISNMYRYYGYGMWLVIDKASNQIIGRAGLEHRDYENTTELEMGYLIDPDWQNQGYATEVCNALIAYANDNLDFPRINCLIQKGNGPSIHLMEKLGFAFLGETLITKEAMLHYTKYCFFTAKNI